MDTRERMTDRRFPVAGTDLTIPWAVAERAQATFVLEWDWPRNPIPLELREKLGGFTEGQLDAWVPGWRENAREDTSTVGD